MQLNAWNDEFGIPDRLYFEHPTSQPAPWAVIKDYLGHTIHVSLNGANVVSWRNAEGADLLHVREDSPSDAVGPTLCVPPVCTHATQCHC